MQNEISLKEREIYKAAKTEEFLKSDGGNIDDPGTQERLKTFLDVEMKEYDDVHNLSFPKDS